MKVYLNKRGYNGLSITRDILRASGELITLEDLGDMTNQMIEVNPEYTV